MMDISEQGLRTIVSGLKQAANPVKRDATPVFRELPDTLTYPAHWRSIPEQIKTHPDKVMQQLFNGYLPGVQREAARGNEQAVALLKLLDAKKNEVLDVEAATTLKTLFEESSINGLTDTAKLAAELKRAQDYQALHLHPDNVKNMGLRPWDATKMEKVPVDPKDMVNVPRGQTVMKTAKPGDPLHNELPANVHPEVDTPVDPDELRRAAQAKRAQASKITSKGQSTGEALSKSAADSAELGNTTKAARAEVADLASEGQSIDDVLKLHGGALSPEDLASLSHLRVKKVLSGRQTETVAVAELMDGRVIKFFNHRYKPDVPTPWTIPVEEQGRFMEGSYPQGYQIVPKVRPVCEFDSESHSFMMYNPEFKPEIRQFEAFAKACGYDIIGDDGLQVGRYWDPDSYQHRMVVFDRGRTGYRDYGRYRTESPEDPLVSFEIDQRVPVYEQCRKPLYRLDCMHVNGVTRSPDLAQDYQAALEKVEKLRRDHPDLRTLIPPSYIRACEEKLNAITRGQS